MLFSEITLRGLLSFGPETPPLPLRRLNVLIGPNGSGKSNLIEAISIFRAAPKQLAAPVQSGGGVSEWIWKGGGAIDARVAALVFNPKGRPIRHLISFKEKSQRFELTDERIEFDEAKSGKTNPSVKKSSTPLALSSFTV